METVVLNKAKTSSQAREPGATASAPSATVSVRRYPYPYKAMLAICSDLDSTPDWRVYLEIMRFLNTTDATAMGRGVGLEVGNSIYFDQRPEEFAYWNTDDAGRAMVRTLVRSGHIDCLHSYGNLATTRAHACRALDELARHGLRLEVWVDHGWSPTNFGPDVMCGHGDEPGHPAYHADVTIPFGIRYVWRGRTSSILGQDVKPSLGGLFTPDHALQSSGTLTKELIKRVLAHCGSRKYAMHGPNRLLRVARLRDGRPVYEFLRSNPHWGGVSSCDTGTGLGHVLTQDMLRRLISRQGACVLYTHLGKGGNPRVPFPASAEEAFRALSAANQAGEILVTTTQRLLRYVATRDALCYRVGSRGGALRITIDSVCDPLRGLRPPLSDDVQGITFEMHHDGPVEVLLSGIGKLPVGITRAGNTTLATVPWQTLVFPNP